MESYKLRNTPFTRFVRALIEIGFIVFLFYSNLLMGEYTQSKSSEGRSLIWALSDIFTFTNFVIAAISGLIGYVVFEFLRRKF